MERKRHLLIFAAMAAFPVAAQDLTGTLRAQGTVMVSTGGDFVRATDGQPVAAGMRLMVGDDGSATVEYGPDCERSYTDAGTYTIVPARCEDNDRKRDDRSRQEDARQDGSQGQGATAAGNGSLLAQLGIIVGAAVVGAVAIDQIGDQVLPDHPLSR